MTRTPTVLILTGILLAASATPAHADVTAFFGLAPTPALRTTRGWSIGLDMLIVGGEFEWASVNERTSEDAPGLSTKMFNGLLVTPTGSTQLYLSAGVGWFTETLGTQKESGFATNVGGGVKVKLLGPVRARVDMRIFRLNDDAVTKTPLRIYAGLNVRF
jgi:hypothetical protein